MKKFVAMMLVLVLVFCMTGCISAEERETVEVLTAKIDQIEITDLDDIADIEEAQSMYDGLSDEAKKRVENYAVLEAKHAEYQQFFTKTVEEVTEAIEQINTAMDEYDFVTIANLINEYLPIARKMVASKYYVSDADPVGIMEDLREMVDEVCYPNTYIVSLKNYALLTSRYSGVTSADETTVNVDSDTNMEYTTYFCNSATDMSKTFIAYTEYLKAHFELDDVTASGTSARYYFLDDQGRRFYVSWAYYSLGYYGTIYTIYVGFAPEIGFAAAVKG